MTLWRPLFIIMITPMILMMISIKLITGRKLMVSKALALPNAQKPAQNLQKPIWTNPSVKFQISSPLMWPTKPGTILSSNHDRLSLRSKSKISCSKLKQWKKIHSTQRILKNSSWRCIESPNKIMAWFRILCNRNFPLSRRKSSLKLRNHTTTQQV